MAWGVGLGEIPGGDAGDAGYASSNGRAAS